MKSYYVYIITNNKNTVLYTGVTNNLFRRIGEHKNKLFKGFVSPGRTESVIIVNDDLGDFIPIRFV